MELEQPHVWPDMANKVHVKWRVTMECENVSQPGEVISSPPEQNGRHFADDIFRCIFVNEKFYSLIKISMKFVSKGPIWH